MITDQLIKMANWFLVGMFSFFDGFTAVDDIAVSSFATLIGYMARLNGLFPVETLFACFALYLGLEAVIFLLRFITGIYSGLRGKNQIEL